MTAPEYRTQVKRWFVETGVCDGDGMGHWIETEESVEVAGEVEANALRDSWLASGKLRTMPWGELRPQNSYALFRIRQVWEDTRAPLAEALVVVAAKLEEEHRLHITALGRDPDKYSSQFSLALDRLNSAIKASRSKA